MSERDRLARLERDLRAEGCTLVLIAHPDALVLVPGVDADGAAVVRVAGATDLSGHGRDLVQPDPALRPVYEPGGINGRPALRFGAPRKPPPTEES